MILSSRTTALLFVAIAGLLCVGAVGSVAGSTQEATNISVGSASGVSGTNATVALQARTDGVSGYEASITYDPSVVRVVSISGADFSEPIVNIDQEAGRVNLTQVSVESVDDPTLARITLQLVGDPSDSTALKLDHSATVLFDENSEEIRIDAYEAGSVAIEQSGTATGTDEAAPTTAAGTSTAPASEQAPTAGSGSENRETASGKSSPLAGVLDSSFLLGAGFVILIVVAAGTGYFLGNRNSGGRSNW
ncbi:cohesin domain-containing protein [Halosimplex amylolyticum]|uniref:cohesin domain-containing protein n=1 Tax=Halosimplex amylolyticum TaxID=3396616 RepID=UPI003F57CA5A